MKPDSQTWDFTDDITLLVEMKENLHDMRRHWQIGLRINSDKMKITLVGNAEMDTLSDWMPIHRKGSPTLAKYYPEMEMLRQTLTAGLAKHLQCSKDCVQLGLHQHLASRPK